MDRLQRIEEERQHQGLSYQQLSDMTMLSKTTVYRTLTQKQDPTPATLSALETALGISEEVESLGDIPGASADYVHLTESRIARMRAHYNGLLAAKDRHLKRCYIIITAALSLIAFIVVVVTMLIIYDLLVPGAGWIG